MSRFVLIHGSWAGAWCWEKLVPLLERDGHTVEAPDLPGHGDDHTPIAEITLQSYVDRVTSVLDGSNEPAILVGHSHGGIVITQTAEERPERIATLVYLCAFLPRNGQSLLDIGLDDPESVLIANLVPSEDGSSFTIRDEAVAEVFFADCSAEDTARAIARLVPEPASSPATPVKTTDERFGSLPRVYIETLRDKAIGPSLQKKMYTATPTRVVSLDTSHSPFLSAPEQLADHLLHVAGDAATAAARGTP